MINLSLIQREIKTTFNNINDIDNLQIQMRKLPAYQRTDIALNIPLGPLDRSVEN